MSRFINTGDVSVHPQCDRDINIKLLTTTLVLLTTRRLYSNTATLFSHIFPNQSTSASLSNLRYS